MDIVVFGAGSLGSLIGGVLAREHPVTLVGRAPHVRAIEERGLTIAGEIQASVTPDATTTVPLSADLVIVTVKAYDTTTAAEALTDCDSTTVLSLQNGIDNETILTAALDAHVLAGTATYGAVLEEPGRVTCTGVGDVVLGEQAGGRSQIADAVGEAFRAAGIETTVAVDMPRRRWEKLAVNAGINAPTALARVPNGALADGPAHGIACEAAREAASVARARDVDLTDSQAIEVLESVIQDTQRNESSMLQDVRAGRRTEIDAINGVVADSEVETPTNDTLAALVRSWERQRKRRE